MIRPPTSRRPAPAPRGARWACPDPEAGFTLVEVLVALALVALVGLALVGVQTGQAASALRLKAHQLAAIEADNQAVELLLAPSVPAARLIRPARNGGADFLVETVPGPSPDPERFPRLATVEVRVRAAEGDGPVLARRVLVRPR
ncbi:MAG: type II secretion system protein GspI [Sphingomonadaceae bacterium]|uniref:prepilin-type N-terminal cleavage/methylation domain-containing protein n=1 Tax=Thermaurantiacus sp. TaxID=2820283 RepID=UPI00298F0961|nr:prepilin-type N-terminal cleavage/methylation domain-containing protein [Thermaurantiacus sp.]MCS6987419.1 type II secretion system protein GspI [Sphingomonadaceae bacterium]MDW8415339.1 prepilin-type N-terminal cleavage/methylation domain-containing protein [Thermaurantiacus sp.]